MFGLVFPGCAETYEEPQQSRRSSPRYQQDRHQKLRHFRENDVIAVPAGVTFWIYNNDENEVELISILDTNSIHNQLDQSPRRFYLAGNQEQEFMQYQQEQQQEQEQSRSRRQGWKREQQQQDEEGNNIFSGFDEEFLAQAFNIDEETARNLKGIKDKREGGIVRIRGGLSLLHPPSRRHPHQRQEQEQEQQPQREQQEDEDEEQSSSQEQRQERQQRQGNALEETVCSMRLRQNIGQQASPDIYNPQAGSLRTVNSLDLPILRWLSLSAEFGSLKKNALFVPHYNLNAHTILYVLKGSARLQVVDCSGNTVFDDELREGQVLTIPQNFVVAAKSQSEPFLYLSFKTNDVPMMATLAGRTSILKAWPVEVVAAAFQLKRDQATQVKNNNNLSFFVPPQQSQSQRRAVA